MPCRQDLWGFPRVSWAPAQVWPSLKWIPLKAGKAVRFFWQSTLKLRTYACIPAWSQYARSVTDLFSYLDRTLGREAFRNLFQVILTDRGSEFTDPRSIECDEYGEIRTRVFYCDPQRSDQKGGCEVTHEMIRRILPKGSSFDHLTQSDIDLMMSHINSYTRKKLGNLSPYRLFSSLYGENLLTQLNLHQIPPNEINLTPKLLNK